MDRADGLEGERHGLLGKGQQERLKLRPRHFHFDIQNIPVLVLEQAEDFDHRLVFRTQANLGRLDLAFYITQKPMLVDRRKLVNQRRQILDFILFFGLIIDVLGDEMVDIITAHPHITALALLDKLALGDGEDGDIERPATQIKDENGLRFLVGKGVDAKGNGGGGGLGQQALHLQPSQSGRHPRGVLLFIIKIGRHRHHHMLYGLFEPFLGVAHHLFQDLGRNLLGREFLPMQFHRDAMFRALGQAFDGVCKTFFLDQFLDFPIGEVPAHKPLDRQDRVGRVLRHPIHSVFANDKCLFLPEQSLCDVITHYGRRQRIAFRIGKNVGFQALDGGDRVGGAQINANSLRHSVSC